MNQKPIQMFWADGEPHCLTDQGLVYWLKRIKTSTGTACVWVKGLHGVYNLPRLPHSDYIDLPSGKKD